MIEPDPQDDLSGRPIQSSGVGRSHGSGLVFLLVTLALILAIGFFYLSKERGNRQAERVTQAANSVDDAAKVVGDAARNAADAFRKDDDSGAH